VNFAVLLYNNPVLSAKTLEQLRVCLRKVLHEQLAIVTALSGMNFNDVLHRTSPRLF